MCVKERVEICGLKSIMMLSGIGKVCVKKKIYKKKDNPVVKRDISTNFLTTLKENYFAKRWSLSGM